MADSDLDVLQKELADIRRRYQSLEGRVKSLERGTVTLPPAEGSPGPVERP